MPKTIEEKPMNTAQSRFCVKQIEVIANNRRAEVQQFKGPKPPCIDDVIKRIRSGKIKLDKNKIKLNVCTWNSGDSRSLGQVRSILVPNPFDEYDKVNGEYIKERAKIYHRITDKELALKDRVMLRGLTQAQAEALLDEFRTEDFAAPLRKIVG